MWLDSMDPTVPKQGCAGIAKDSIGVKYQGCCQLYIQPRTLSWLTNTVMLPRASCVIFQGKGVVALIHFFWMMIYIKGFWESRNNFGQLNSPDLHDDRSQMWLKKTTGDTSPFFLIYWAFVWLWLWKAAILSLQDLRAGDSPGKRWQDVGHTCYPTK